MPLTLYHASPVRFRKGDIIHGVHPRKNYDFCGDTVYLNIEPILHYTIASDVLQSKKRWFIYEVLPLEDVVYGGCWDELMCRRVEVIRCVGDAKALYHNKVKTKPSKNKNIFSGAHKHKIAPYIGKIKGVTDRYGKVKFQSTYQERDMVILYRDTTGNAVSRKRQRRLEAKEKRKKQVDTNAGS